MTASPSTQLRAFVVAAIVADTACKATALGATPRVLNRVPSEGHPDFPAFPFLRIAGALKPYDTTEGDGLDGRGHEHSLSLFMEGERFGDKEGETIFEAVRRLVRSLAPADLGDHRLVNIEFEDEEVAAGEDGKRYFGLQRWRAVTEEKV